MVTVLEMNWSFHVCSLALVVLNPRNNLSGPVLVVQKYENDLAALIWIQQLCFMT